MVSSKDFITLTKVVRSLPPMNQANTSNSTYSDVYQQMSVLHEAGLIFYIPLAVFSEVAFAFYINLLSKATTIDVSIKFLSTHMAMCCFLCTLNQLGVYFFEILLYHGSFASFQGFTPALCISVFAAWCFCGQMVLFLGLIMSAEILAISKGYANGEITLRLQAELCFCWLFSVLCLLSGIEQASQDTNLYAICDPVARSETSVRLFVFTFYAVAELTSGILLDQASRACRKKNKDHDRGTVETVEQKRRREISNTVNAFKRPIDELNAYNFVQTLFVYLFYVLSDSIGVLLQNHHIVLINFWLFEFQHAFAGILGIQMIVKTHPELYQLASRSLGRIRPVKRIITGSATAEKGVTEGRAREVENVEPCTLQASALGNAASSRSSLSLQSSDSLAKSNRISIYFSESCSEI